MHINLHEAALWPLRSLGLDPGRAVVNARPTPEQVRARRAEQFVYIASQYVSPHPDVPFGGDPRATRRGSRRLPPG